MVAKKSKLRSEVFKNPNEVILPPLRAHVVGEFNRPNPDRGKHIHVSELSRDDWCARRAWLRLSGEESDPVPPLTWSTSNVFQEGSYIQRKYEDWFWEMGVLWGQFMCMDCGHRFFALSPESCEICDGRLQYKEVPFTADEYMISGHIDMALILESGPVLVEVKSVGLGTIRIEAPWLYSGYSQGVRTLDQLWGGVNRPFPTHRKQGGLYIVLAPSRVRGLEDATTIQFLYEFKANQEVKEFGLSAEKAEAEVSHLLEEAKMVVDALRNDLEVKHPEWANPEGKVCMACSMRTACWGGGDEVEPTKVKVNKASASARRRALGSAR